MPKAKDARADEAFRLYKQGLKLIEISKQLDVKEGTVRSWKNRYNWDNKTNATLQKKKRNAAKNKKAKKEVVTDEVKEVMQNTELTDKQQLFCIYYIRCFNAVKAYQKAYGVAYETAESSAYRMLVNDRVKAQIQRLKQERINREFMSEEDIFQKYIDIAFADITDYAVFGTKEVEYVDKKGNEHTAELSFVNLKDSTEVDGSLVSEVSQGKDGAKIKLADRMKALQWLSDHMDLATEKQRAEIQVLKAKINKDNGFDYVDDGFIDALNASAGEDWSDDEDC